MIMMRMMRYRVVPGIERVGKRFLAIPTDNDSKTSTPPPPQSGIKLDQDYDEEDMVEMFNEETGEWNGPRGLEPTRYGDWESKGRCWDF